VATLSIDTSAITEVIATIDDAVATFNNACGRFQDSLYPYHSLLRYEHLKPSLQEVSRPICELGIAMAGELPPGPLVGDMLRELWRAKNLAVAKEANRQPRDGRGGVFDQAHLFRYEHLAEGHQDIAWRFHSLAEKTIENMAPGEARPVVDLLWEAKNLAVAASLA
jgi:hypothetical protein